MTHYYGAGTTRNTTTSCPCDHNPSSGLIFGAGGLFSENQKSGKRRRKRRKRRERKREREGKEEKKKRRKMMGDQNEISGAHRKLIESSKGQEYIPIQRKLQAKQKFLKGKWCPAACTSSGLLRLTTPHSSRAGK